MDMTEMPPSPAPAASQTPDSDGPEDAGPMGDIEEKGGKYIYSEQNNFRVAIIFCALVLLFMLYLIVNQLIDPKPHIPTIIIGAIIGALVAFAIFKNSYLMIELDPQAKIASLSKVHAFGSPQIERFEFSQISAVEFKLTTSTYTETQKQRVNSPGMSFSAGGVNIGSGAPKYKTVKRKKTSVDYEANLRLSDNSARRIGSCSRKESRALAKIIGCQFVELSA